MKAIGTILIVSLCLGCAATRGGRDVTKAKAGFLDDYSILEENPEPGAQLRYLRKGVYWKRYDKRAKVVRSFDRYDRGGLGQDVLWWDVMTDGKLDGSFSDEVQSFRESHPDYRYERRTWSAEDDADDELAAAAVAGDDGFADSFYDAS